MGVKYIKPEERVHNHSHEPILVLNNVSFGYTRRSHEIKNLSFDIHIGEWTTVLGPNGSGKSTVAKLIVRIEKARKGEILLGNKSIKEYKNKEYARKLAYIPQIMDVPMGISVYDFVAFGRNPWLNFAAVLTVQDKAIIKAALIKIDAWDLRDKMMEEISGGQRQRVLLALAIAQSSEIIVLDEPTTYLDIKAQYEVLEVLAQLHDEGKTIITILHDINQAVQYSDEIVILKAGKIYSRGIPEEVVTEAMLRDVYGVQTKLYVDDNKRKYITDIQILDDVK